MPGSDYLAAARRFADEEPFQQAGVYADVLVFRFLNLLGCTMWDRPPAPHLGESTFLVARWAPVPAEVATRRRAELLRAAPWVFFGLLISADGARSVGAAGAIDVPADVARVTLRDVLACLGQELAPVESHRWQRGGRRA